MNRTTLLALVGTATATSCTVDRPHFNRGCPPGYVEEGRHCVAAGGTAGADGGNAGAPRAGGGAMPQGGSAGTEQNGGTAGTDTGGMLAGGFAGAPQGGTSAAGAQSGGEGGDPLGASGAAGAPPTQPVLQWTITKQGETLGTGLVRLDVNGADVECGSSCSGSVPLGGDVTLTVPLQGKAGYWFTGWDGACTGNQLTCTVSGNEAATVTANFEAVNFAFVTSEEFPANLSATNGLGVLSYDEECNRLATAAGINRGGDAYIAVMYDSVRDPTTRLASSRGWVRTDGEPFMDEPVLTNVMNAIELDENGIEATEIAHVGTSDRNCDNWTTTTGIHTGGSPRGGSSQWLNHNSRPCDFALAIICMSRTASAEITPPQRSAARVVYLSEPFTVAPDAAPDAQCAETKPTGAGTVRALLARPNLAPATFVEDSFEYVRPDGVLVGTGAELRSGTIRSGIWQDGSGDYVGALISGIAALTGSSSLNTAGTVDSTCHDWTDSSGSAAIREANWDNLDTWWSGASNRIEVCGGPAARVYCIEQ